jgi:glycosyltransferase involved in cell wall biosynthesis
VVVREFLTLPLFAVAPFLVPWRHRIWFVCQHNAAFARTHPVQRIALQALRSLGFRFAVLEDVHAWPDDLSGVQNAEGVRALLHPVPPKPPALRRYPADKPTTVGIVGLPRREKSLNWAADAILADMASGERLIDCRLLLGSPHSEHWRAYADRALVVDTSSNAAYLDALLACDVIVLPYDPSAYAYRCSGVLAEAVACGCAVVVPNLPVLRSQVQEPVPVGTTYSERSMLVDATARAVMLSRRRSFGEAIAAHLSARGIDGTRASFNTLLADCG